MKLAVAPSLWFVTLADGSLIRVWAAAVEGLSGPDDARDYLFENLMDIAPADQGDFDVIGRTPSDPERVRVTVALFLRSSVRDIQSGMAA